MLKKNHYKRNNLILFMVILAFLVGGVFYIIYPNDANISSAQEIKKTPKIKPITSKIKVVSNINDLQISDSKIEDNKFTITSRSKFGRF